LQEEIAKRHEALIDDREALERHHRDNLDEMMAELKKRQERIASLEKELEGTSQRASKAEKRLSNVEEAASEAEKIKDENRSLQTQLCAKENEVFEINFEVKGMQSKLKLLQTERDELQASLGEMAHTRDELQSKSDKLERQLLELQEELESSQDEAGRLMADLSDAREKTALLEGQRAAHEEERKQLGASLVQATERAQAAEESSKASVAAGLDDSSKAEQLSALQEQMESWLDDMRVLKTQEQAAVQDAATKGKQLTEAMAERDKAVASLEEAQKQVEELNAINTKLVGHSNAKQKVQHVVKMKEENNELHASLKKTQGELTKLKDKASRLEKEVDKLRGALGVEGGATQVLAEEERIRARLAAKEEEYKVLVAQMQAVLDKALSIAPGLGGAGEAQAVCSTGEGDKALCERVGRVLGALSQRMHDDAAELDAQRKALKNRDFETELLKKQLQLRGGSAPAHAPGLRSAPGASDDFENQHPNSPSCVNLGKTPGKITGQSTSKSSRRSAFAKHQD
jgi:chromosome segregation ATPase